MHALIIDHIRLRISLINKKLDKQLERFAMSYVIYLKYRNGLVRLVYVMHRYCS